MIIEKEMILNYTYAFESERQFSYDETHRIMEELWKTSFLYSAIYIILAFALQHFMKNRPKFELRVPLILWNVFLAVFSLIGFYRSASELLHMLFNFGFKSTICTTNYADVDPVCGYWTWLFTLSKLVEFGDTLFVVLRKQQLIFLHWYHHSTVLIYTWFSYGGIGATGNVRWFIVMNFGVHSVMYTYFAIKAAKIYLPRVLSVMITLLQIVQMIGGITISIIAKGYSLKYSYKECRLISINIDTSIALYISFMVLFSMFFYNSYISTSSQKIEGIRKQFNKSKISEVVGKNLNGTKKLL